MEKIPLLIVQMIIAIIITSIIAILIYWGTISLGAFLLGYSVSSSVTFKWALIVFSVHWGINLLLLGIKNHYAKKV